MIKHIAFVFGFVVIGLLFGGVSASATEYVSKEQLVGNKAYVEFRESTGNVYIIVAESATDFIWDGNYLTHTGHSNLHYSSSNGLYWSTGTKFSGVLALDYFDTFLSTNTTVYTSKAKDTVFFTAPNPFVMTQVERVEEIPTVMKATLVDGGVLSTGLMVLAILLGVFLVPRLIYSFLR